MNRLYRLAFAVCCVACAACSSRPDRSAEFDALLDKAVSRGFPAFAFLVAEPDAPVWSGAAGYSDLEHRTPASPDDGYHMASITKVFTAVATLRLIDAEQLSLDARLMDLLDASLVGPIPHAEEITIAQLLTHRSGLYAPNNDPEYWDVLLGSQAGSGREWTAAEIVGLAHEHRNEPLHKPGEGQAYGDINYVLLGLIIEQVSGIPLRTHVRETLLEPLGMRSTYFLSRYVGGNRPRPGKPVQGYLKLSDEIRAFIQINEMFPRAGDDLLNTTAALERIDAAAGLVTTMHDLYAFGRALFDGELLSPQSQRWLVSTADNLAETPPGTERLGILRAYRKPYGVLITAEGDGPGGVVSLLAWHPETETVIVAFTNIFGMWDEAEFMQDEIVAAIIER